MWDHRLIERAQSLIKVSGHGIRHGDRHRVGQIEAQAARRAGLREAIGKFLQCASMRLALHLLEIQENIAQAKRGLEQVIVLSRILWRAEDQRLKATASGDLQADHAEALIAKNMHGLRVRFHITIGIGNFAARVDCCSSAVDVLIILNLHDPDEPHAPIELLILSQFTGRIGHFAVEGLIDAAIADGLHGHINQEVFGSWILSHDVTILICQCGVGDVRFNFQHRDQTHVFFRIV